MTNASTPLVEVEGLSKHFRIGSGFKSGLQSIIKGARDIVPGSAAKTGDNLLRAVENVSFNLYKGKTTGLVGESGCGKSTVARLLTGLLQPSAGSIRYRGEERSFGENGKNRHLRKSIQMIFQDPYGSLDPRKRLQTIINRPLLLHTALNRLERKERTIELLKMVGLNEDQLLRFPHEFSGGQRQRIAVARALAVEPEILVCDEPVSALDVSIQARILNLLQDLQERLDLTYLFISHDLGVIEHISDRIIVMYLGTISEIADAEELYKRPLHPYTRGLIASAPGRGRRNRGTMLKGDIESPAEKNSGCRFVNPCPIKIAQCYLTPPELKDVGGNHKVACFNIQEPGVERSRI